jgi:tetratricopeptide (TPR) repeat protein
MTSHREYRARFDSILNSLAKSNSQDVLVLSTLAVNKMSEGSAQSDAAAEDYFQRALRAGSINAEDFELLATLQANAGRAQDAMATVKRGLKANPYSPRLYQLLAELFISIGARDDALKTMKEDLELFPEDTFMRSLIEKVQNAQGQGDSRSKDPR